MADSHTKGPWKSYKDGVHPVLENGSSGNDHFAICQCFGPDALHNQRLIAAAPDMLDALRDAKGLADMAVMSDDLDGTPSDDQDALVRLRAKIDAAISKATSRQPEGER